jgi:hypothetical protein
MKFTFDPENGYVIGARGKPIGVFVRHDGYVDIRYDGRYVGKAHRLIWESVHGPIPEGLEINHRNGIRWDNRIDNLELVTKSQNKKHSYDMKISRADGEFNGRRIGRRRRVGM